MQIDVHAHYWAESYINALAEAGRPDLGHAKQADDLDERLKLLDETGTDLQIFSAIGLNVDVEDPTKAASTARHINDLYKTIADKYDGRFTGFASVPLPHVDEAIIETDRALGELGLAGIGLPCISGGRPIDHPDFEPFWANVARHEAVVYIHPVGADSLAHPGLGDFHLNMGIGSPMQIAMAALRIALSGLSTRYPKITFIFAMCGGILPYLWPRYESNLKRGIASAALTGFGAGFYSWMKDLPLSPDDPMAFMRDFWYDTSVQDIPLALHAANETYGADRILLGSDEIFASLTEAIDMVRNSPDLTEDQKTGILGRNAEGILKLHRD
jgi:predicted TIM-barrel fold metal-dependent hydrolase